MKPTFKTTALSLLVALGVVACGSGSGSGTDSAPNNAASNNSVETNKQAEQAKQKAEEEKRKMEAEKQKAEEEKRKAEVEKQKAEEEKRKTEAEKQKAEEEKRKAEAEKQQVEKDAQQNTGTTVKADAVKENAEVEKYRLDSDNNEWRVISINNYFAGKSNYYSHDSESSRSRTQLPAPYEKNTLEQKSPFNQRNSSVALNLNDLTKQDIQKGGTFLGTHQGVYQNDEIKGLKVTELGKVDKNKMQATKVEDVHSVNYLFVNQPYASYGALFTNEHDAELFSTGLRTDNYDNFYQTKDDGELVYKDNVKGDATYKGQVIAQITRGNANSYTRYTEAPSLDGDVTIQAHFGDRAEKNFVKGEINSKTVGKIELKELNQGTRSSFSSELEGAEIRTGGELVASGAYSGSFVGKDASEVIGEVNLEFVNARNKYPHTFKKDAIAEYKAVFGAEKQAK